MESEISSLQSKMKTQNQNLSDMDQSDALSVRSSKRETKVPQKFSDFTPNKGSIFVKTKSPGSEQDLSGGETVVRTIKIKRSLTPENCESIRSRNSSGSSSRRCSSTERYRCDDCDKCFKKKSHLDEHLLIHSGEKPFKCDKCGWSFRRNDKMRKHMETCNYVNREHEYSSFIRTGKVRSVVGVAPEMPLGVSRSGRWEEGVHICRYCQKDCGYKQNLYFHEKQHDKENVEATDDTPVAKRGRGRPPGSVVARSSRPSVGGEVEEDETKDTNKEDNKEATKEANKTKWRNGVPPSYWVSISLLLWSKSPTLHSLSSISHIMFEGNREKLSTFTF